MTCPEQVSAAVTAWFTALEASVQEAVKKVNCSLFSAFQPEGSPWPTAVHSKSFPIRHSPFILLSILPKQSYGTQSFYNIKVAELVKKFSLFYGARSFITLFKTARHLPLC